MSRVANPTKIPRGWSGDASGPTVSLFLGRFQGSGHQRDDFTIISAFAQLERDQLSERTKAGMAVAASHGRKAGRQEITAAHANVKRARDLKTQGLKPADIGKIIGASRATIYRYLSMEPG
ncbi:recombinase family protein [Arthrobacter sp. A5]|uniref:recombinase family protein n=1 Tax=Arthrobacter sp. A5 TaxID=576926 RepID=UPI003DA803DD